MTTSSPCSGAQHKEQDTTPLEQLLCNKDNEGFITFLDRMRDEARGYLQKFIRNSHDVEDVLQEANLKTWTHFFRGSYDLQQPFRPWYFTILRSAAIDWLRKAQKRPTVSLDRPNEHGATLRDVCAVECDPSAQLCLCEDIELLQHHISEIQAPLVEAIRLVMFTGLTYAEAAACERVPSGTMKSRVRICIEQLRRRMAPDLR